MENEIDDDALAAMLAEDDQDEELISQLSFIEQTESITPDQPVDEPTPTVPKSPTYKFSDADMGDLFGSKISKYANKSKGFDNIE
jgi:hypothetical protein